MTYWDVSAFVPLIHQEATSATLRALYAGRGDHLALATMRVEVECVVARLLHEGRIDVAHAAVLRRRGRLAFDKFALVTPNASVIESAVRLARADPVDLRAGDALHLAAWQSISAGDPSVEFVCLDHRLKRAALSEGATVLP